MGTLTKRNAREHCRTCLINLRELQHEELTEKIGCNNLQYDKVSINMKTDAHLLTLMNNYLGKKSVNTIENFPNHMCFSCCTKLTDFDRFNKCVESSEKLLMEVFKDDNIFKEEINNECSDTLTSADTNIYNLFLKETVMEPETVLLDSTVVTPISGIESYDPDPFGMTLLKDDMSNNFNEWQKYEGLFSTQSDSDNSDSSYSVDKDIKSKKTSSINNNGKVVLKEVENEDCSKNSEKDKKEGIKKKKIKAMKQKRRTKQEMAEWRRSESEKYKKDIRRRQKGTRNSYKCMQCNHCFAHKITYDAHVRKVHEGSKKPFQCDRCDKSYSFIGGLYTHIKEIHDAEVRSYHCDHPGCDRVYTSFIAMHKHKRLKHTGLIQQKKYVCEQCGATFVQSGNLKYHRRNLHPTEAEQAERAKSKERFECEICKKFFHSQYTLKYHTLQLHSKDTTYECNICGRRMAKKFMLIQHMLVHSTDKTPCEHCGKQFIRKFELESHIRAVHMKLKPYECQYCSECFASRKTLRHHEYIHTGEKPYVCDLCGRAYRQQTSLKNHRKSHDKINSENLLVTNVNRVVIGSLLTADGEKESQTGCSHTILKNSPPSL